MSYQNFNNRPQSDQVLVEIANYAASYTIQSDLAYEIARYFESPRVLWRLFGLSNTGRIRFG